MGGEKCIPFSKSESITGSPPRRRGKAGKNGGCDFGDRITPAWAGKSQGHRADRGAEQDHPRMGGEKAESAEPATDKQGSPPRRRGKEAVLKSAVNTSWITPAQAGKRCPHSLPRHFWQDHPRAGGEKQQRPTARPCNPGSPPRRRGKGRSLYPVPSRLRITPAQAGKSYLVEPPNKGLWDHPRAGGEKAARPGQVGRQPGSPPRRRGKGKV